MTRKLPAGMRVRSTEQPARSATEVDHARLGEAGSGGSLRGKKKKSVPERQFCKKDRV